MFSTFVFGLEHCIQPNCRTLVAALVKVRGEELIYCHGPHELCISAGWPHNQL